MRVAKTKYPLLVLALLAIPSAPLLAQEREHGGTEHSGNHMALYNTDLETLESKFIELAEAMPADKYTWRPMDSVRTVSEVFMLIAAENYAIPSAWGAARMDGAPERPFQTMPAVTSKTQVLDHLRRSFTYYRNAVGHIDGEKLHSNIQFFGRERTVNEALFIMSGDMHEHLGQAIAYARMNQIVPPWTARQQSN